MPMLGSNFFPSVDSGQILIHARVPTGTRVEETAQRFARIEQAIRRVIPSEEIATLVDVIGLPPSSINLTYNNTGVIGSQDGDIQIALRKDHQPTADYVRELREVLPREFPDTVFSFPPADIVSQILNFGAPAPIDLQIRGNDLEANFAYANQLLKAIRAHPRRGRRTHPAVQSRAGVRGRRRPYARAGPRAHRARRDQQPGRQPGRQQPGVRRPTG